MTSTACKHRSATTLAAVVGSLITLASLTQQIDGPRQLSASEAEYCEMHALWKKDTRRGFAPDERSGWPDFNGNAASLCAPILSADNHQLALR